MAEEKPGISASSDTYSSCTADHLPLTHTRSPHKAGPASGDAYATEGDLSDENSENLEILEESVEAQDVAASNETAPDEASLQRQQARQQQPPQLPNEIHIKRRATIADRLISREPGKFERAKENVRGGFTALDTGLP